MTGSRAGVLRIGDRVRLGGSSQTVAGLSGTLVHLADERGATMALQLPLMLADPSFERLGQHTSAPLLPAGFLNTVPKDQVARAEWWNQHLIEVITGQRPDGANVALRLRRHPPGTLTGMDRYLHHRTAGMIGSLSHLIRAAAITAILEGTEAITKDLLDGIPVDHAAQSRRDGAA